MSVRMSLRMPRTSVPIESWTKSGDAMQWVKQTGIHARASGFLMRWLDMDDYIDDVGKRCHEPILDHVRERMGFAEWCAAVNPEVQIDEHVVGRPAGPNLLASDDSR